MLMEARATRKLYEAFFTERSSWYARRAHLKSLDAAKRKNPAKSPAPADAHELVRDEIRGATDGQSSEVQPEPPDLRTPDLEVIDETFSLESSDGPDGPGDDH